MLSQVLEHLKQDQAAALERFEKLLSIPSVSTDPAYGSHVNQAAQWLVDELNGLGLQARVMPTGGHPVVVAETPGPLAATTERKMLFYGHYDVQPPDPLEKWTSPPFTPTRRAGAIYARGASDDKGPVCCFIEALRAWLKTTGKLPLPVTLMIEGEEECGGEEHLIEFIKKNKKLLQADLALVSDTGVWEADGQTIPAITYGLRGLVYFDIQLHGPKRDLHSGAYGGILANPATMLMRVIAKLFDENNRLTIPGFYDDVQPVSAEEKACWAKLPFDEVEQFKSLGVSRPFGEKGFDLFGRMWARPCCDVNGMYGGYEGEGAKTIIPAFAGAKISFRLPAKQDPRRIVELVENWLRAQDTGGCTWKIQRLGAAHPVLVPMDSPYMRAAARGLRTAFGRDPVLIREGATIPVVADIQQLLGLDAILIGFGKDDDCIHSPNEKFDLEMFAQGCRAHACLLEELAKGGE
ncbi:MAG: dipeptidase [Phycisphaeraceae bacterium]|nr:dipeptidase [Phycisphaeraceae bacterium]